MSPNPWRTRAIIGGAILLALVGAFSAGRFSAPLQVQTRDVEHVVFKDRVVTVEKLVERVVTVEKEAKVETKIVWRDRIILKDGTVKEHEVEQTGTKQEATKTATTDKADDKNTVTLHQGETIRETTKTVTLQPRWRVAALVGASWNPPLLPIAGPLVLGLEGNIRIIGGVSAGVWANTGGAAGLSVALEF